MSKGFAAIFAALVIVIVSAKYASNVSMDTGFESPNEAWATDQMDFVTWNDGRWTAWIHEGGFEQVPQDSGSWHRHSKASIAFLDWEGEPWQAKVEDGQFILAKHGNWDDSVERSESIRYLDWHGNKRLRTVADLRR